MLKYYESIINLLTWFTAAVLSMIAIYCIYRVCKFVHYRRGAFYKFTRRPRNRVNRKDGTRCECDTYEQLRKFEKAGCRFMFGLYIPKITGGTTEIDMLMISPKGLFVVENKDFSGSVIGLEGDRYWDQENMRALNPEDRNRKFYNPIKQNDGHIRNLRAIVGNKLEIRSVIVFADRCKIYVPRLSRNDVRVTHCKTSYAVIQRMYNEMPGNMMSAAEINALYNDLMPYARVSNHVKRQHIAAIQSFAA